MPLHENRPPARSVISMLLAVTLGVLAAPLGLRAVPVIDVPDVVLLPDTPGQTVEITIRGGDAVQGLVFYAQSGDGGPELADAGLPPGTDGPAITAVDLKTGTIYAAVADEAVDPGSLPQVAIRSLPISASGVTVTAEGLLATLTIDTTGLTGGTFDLRLNGVLPFDDIGGPFTTTFEAGGQPVIPQINNGSITIAIPEPAFAAVALFTLAARRRHRSQSGRHPW